MTATAQETAVEPQPETSEDESPAATTPEPDLEVILPENGRVQVAGVECEVRRMKSREFLLLMRVLTNGIGQGLTQVRFTSDNPDEVRDEFLALLMLAIPESIEEFGQFLIAMVQPVQESDRAKVAVELRNPDMDVMLDALGVMAEQEKDEFANLMGKARAWISRLQKTLGTKTPTG